MYRYSNLLLKKIRRHLNNGGIIAYPTESCYGFGCDPFNYKAVAKIIKLKGRSKSKGLIVIAGEQSQLKGIIKPLTSEDKLHVREYWPGAYSLILPVTTKVPRNLIGSHPKIAVRVSKNVFVWQLCNFLRMPLVSTSANKSGHRAVKTYRDCIRQFGKSGLVLPGKTDYAKRPSTIIDWETKRILRK